MALPPWKGKAFVVFTWIAFMCAVVLDGLHGVGAGNIRDQQLASGISFWGAQALPAGYGHDSIARSFSLVLERSHKCSSSLHDVLLFLSFPVYPGVLDAIALGNENEFHGEGDSVVNESHNMLEDVMVTSGSISDCNIHENDDNEWHHAQENASHVDSDTNVGGNITRNATNALNKTSESFRINTSDIHIRLEPGDGAYNYASETKGAKILATNKEAKGAPNILNKDKDKYMRVPCSAENKFVEMELSEETLVVNIVLANHEFYSSNIREFELWGSSIYPTENWTFLGKFEAENTRVPQTFLLPEPKWVRYLKIRMLSHYGSEFYCTLSVVVVHGVDVIEWMLKDWIAEEAGAKTMISSSGSIQEDVNGIVGLAGTPPIDKGMQIDKGLSSSVSEKENFPPQRAGELLELDGKVDNSSPRSVDKAEKMPLTYHQSGRTAVDAVMKLLMQKVRSLEHNQPLLSQYLKELNARYSEVFKVYERDSIMMAGKLHDAANELSNLNMSLHTMKERWNYEKALMENSFSQQAALVNLHVESLRKQLQRMEDKEMVALLLAFLSILIVVVAQVLAFSFSFLNLWRHKGILHLHSTQSLWIISFISCLVIVFVLCT